MTETLFEPRGKVSLAAACEDIIRGLEENDGISYPELLAEIEERTELADVTIESANSAMRRAVETLHRNGEPGADNVRQYGWVRQTPQRIVRSVEGRFRRGRRQFRRGAWAAGAADVERLEWADRQRLEFHTEVSRRVADMERRRAERSRPIEPPTT